jgi:hypothetical protein
MAYFLHLQFFPKMASPFFVIAMQEINVGEYRMCIQKWQSRETGNIGHIRQRQTNQNTTQYVLDNTICKQTQIA